VVTGTPVAETKGFIGERYDADAGLQYLNARYYDPKLGLFLQPDWFEVTEAGVGTNRYAYAGNDPVNLRDPGGNVAGVDDVVLGVGLLGAITIDMALDYLNDGKLNNNGPFSAPISSTLGYIGDTVSSVAGGKSDGRDSEDGSAGSIGGVQSATGGGCDDESDCRGLDKEESPTFYRGGTSLKAEPKDVQFDKTTGLVRPTRGISLNSVKEQLPSRFSESIRIDPSSIPKELQVVQRGSSATHFEVVPREPMTFERYQQLLDKIRILGN
jgi:RHS repeat-associated protein